MFFTCISSWEQLRSVTSSVSMEVASGIHTSFSEFSPTKARAPFKRVDYILNVRLESHQHRPLSHCHMVSHKVPLGKNKIE